MDENINVTGMEETVTPEAEHDDWDDIDLSDISDNEEAEPERQKTGDADQQEPEPKESGQAEPAEMDDQKDGQEEADQLFTLKHLDETRQVGRDEVIALAQKGMDYDRIREDRDQARAEAARLAELEEFLKELAAPSGMSIPDLMDTTRANILAEREGIDQSVALQRIKLDRDRKALEAERQSMARQTEAGQQQAAEQARMKASMDRFIQDHPNLDAKDIPNEVWEAFAGGKDLADAYAIYEAKNLREELAAKEREIETMKQNKTNQDRSTGSQTTAGTSKEELDWIDKDWYDGT